MEWIRGETIGHGSFASVSLAKATKPICQNSQFPPLMAVKTCPVSCSVSLQKEKSILDELRDCPEIINCFGDDYSFEHGEKLYNVMLEYAEGGNLADKIKKSSLPESDVRKYTNSILKGLDFIHRIGYVHCDIKLQNLLLFNDGIKIADFGLSKQINQENQAKNQENGYELRGTPLYMSPEVVSAGELAPAADIWALGCVVSEMISGTPVWNCRRESDVGALLMRIAAGNETPDIPAKISEEGKDFLTKCFVKDPEHRWTAEMLLNHPFVNHQILTVDDKHRITPSTSPTSAFDFPNWPSIQCSITSLPLTEYSYFPSSSPSERLRKLLNNTRPDWSVTNEWVTLR